MKQTFKFLYICTILASFLKGLTSCAFASNKRPLDEITAEPAAKKARLSSFSSGRESDPSLSSNDSHFFSFEEDDSDDDSDDLSIDKDSQAKIEALTKNADKECVAVLNEFLKSIEEVFIPTYLNQIKPHMFKWSAEDFRAYSHSVRIFCEYCQFDKEDGVDNSLESIRTLTEVYFGPTPDAPFYCGVLDIFTESAAFDFLEPASKSMSLILEDWKGLSEYLKAEYHTDGLDGYKALLRDFFLLFKTLPASDLVNISKEACEIRKTGRNLEDCSLLISLNRKNDWLSIVSILAFFKDTSIETRLHIKEQVHSLISGITDTPSMFGILCHLKQIPELFRNDHANILSALLKPLKRQDLFETLFSLNTIPLWERESIAKAAAIIMRNPHFSERKIDHIFTTLMKIPAQRRTTFAYAAEPIINCGFKTFSNITLTHVLTGLAEIPEQNLTSTAHAIAKKQDYVEFLLSFNLGYSNPDLIHRTIYLGESTKSFKRPNHYQYEAVGEVLARRTGSGSGTLISPNLVLTAAHVIYEDIKPFLKEDEFKNSKMSGPVMIPLSGEVTFLCKEVIDYWENGLNKFLEFNRKISVSKIVLDAKYLIDTKDRASDLALLVLKTPIFSINPIPCVSLLEKRPTCGLLVGYGRRPLSLRCAAFKHAFCQEILHNEMSYNGKFGEATASNSFRNPWDQIEWTRQHPEEQKNLLKLVGGSQEKLAQLLICTASAPGDSGGPLVAYNSHEDELCIVGVCSTGDLRETTYAFLAAEQRDGTYRLNKGFKKMLAAAEDLIATRS